MQQKLTKSPIPQSISKDLKPQLLENSDKTEKPENTPIKSKEKDTRIKVFIRKRPLLKSETGKTDLISFSEKNSIIINDGTNIITSTFDGVFNEYSDQSQVFESLRPQLELAFLGFNLSVFAYGQTGSGKTYTMFGADWDSIVMKKLNINNANNKQQHTFFQDIETDKNFAGIIPRTIYEIFNIIKNKGLDNSFNVFCTFMQIYNEKIFDLLQDKSESKPLNIHENKIEGIFVEGLTEYSVNTAEDCLMLMRRGEKNRITRPTLMNTKSSRSHTIFQFLIESSKADKNGNLQKAKVNLCDLAGSEKINKDEQMELGHLSELKNINLSLTTLGKIIHILSNQSKLPLPFRESKLTRLLQDSLGGNTQTYIIANIAPVIDCIDETISTLKFAERAKNVIIKVRVNEISATDDALISKLQKEINYLKDLLKMKRKNGLAGGVQDIHSKLIHLQQENDRLRQNFVSIDEVEKLIFENKSMKMELQKMHTITYENEFIESNNEINVPSNNNFERKDTEDYGEIFTKLRTKNETRETFPLSNPNQKKNSYNSENLSHNLKYSSSNSNHSNFFFAGKLIAEPKTEVIIRMRGKNNNIETKKGFVETTMEEHKREENKLKDKLRTIERLKDLERIQKSNEEKLKIELEKIDANKNNKYNIFQIKNQKEQDPQITRQKKRIEEYNKKIKLYEKNFLKI